MEEKLCPCIDFEGATWMLTEKELIMKVEVVLPEGKGTGIVTGTLPLEKLNQLMKAQK